MTVSFPVPAFLLSFSLIYTTTASQIWAFASSVEVSGRISRSSQTQVIKMGICSFQCKVPLQWILQQQVGPVSIYCDRIGCHVLCLRNGIPVWLHFGQSTTATSRQAIWSQMLKRCQTPINNKQPIPVPYHFSVTALIKSSTTATIWTLTICTCYVPTISIN